MSNIQTQNQGSSSNGNPNTEGNKKNNTNWQTNMLKALGMVISAINAGGGGGCCPTAATEATLASVLAALQNGQEFEQNLVTDLGGVGCPANCPTYLQIRIFDTVTHTFGPPVYYDAAGAVVVPVGPLQLVNPQFVLENILTQVTAINADLDVALSTRASEATLLAIKAQIDLLTFIGTALEVSVTSSVLPTGAATEATLTSILGQLDVALSTRASEATLLAVNANLTGAVRTYTTLVAIGVGTVPAGSRVGSMLNSGSAAGTWNGVSIPAGVGVPFDAGGRLDTLPAIAFDATGTTFIIEYTS